MEITILKKEIFSKYFTIIDDFRIDRKKLYPLEEILFIVVCGSICEAESWKDFVIFGNKKQDYLLRQC